MVGHRDAELRGRGARTSRAARGVGIAARSLHAPEPQPVTFVELFFDLVFVFAVTQTTVALAHDLTWAGGARSLLLFWLIWWAWTVHLDPWLLVVAADVGAATYSGRGKTCDLSPSHVAERHGLFVIIALGESLIVAGTAVAGDERTAELVTAALASVVVVALLWWTYFDWFKDLLEAGLEAASPADLGRLTRDAYSLSHFPLVCGIIGIAVAVEEIMVHPGDPAPRQVLVALATGVALFLGSTVVAHRRLHGELLVSRVAIVVATAAAVLVFPDWQPFWPLAAAALGLVALIVLERRHAVEGPADAVRAG